MNELFTNEVGTENDQSRKCFSLFLFYKSSQISFSFYMYINNFEDALYLKYFQGYRYNFNI